jgi:hypothetical protein
LSADGPAPTSRVCWFVSYLWRTNDAASWRPDTKIVEGEHPLDWYDRAVNVGAAIKLVAFSPVDPRVAERHRGKAWAA